jgi:cytochrome b561
MPWLNNTQQWGWFNILVHWLSAIVVIGLFTLGLWMVELTYYDTWYHKAPHIHKSVGLLLFILTLLRLIWLFFNGKPAPLSSHTRLEKKLAKWVHWLLYLLLLTIMISGYLISTADGRSIDVFNWFSIPALVSGLEEQADLAGKVHYYLAMSLIVLAALHAFAAFKHHFLDKDKTLTRMLGLNFNKSKSDH